MSLHRFLRATIGLIVDIYFSSLVRGSVNPFPVHRRSRHLPKGLPPHPPPARGRLSADSRSRLTGSQANKLSLSMFSKILGFYIGSTDTTDDQVARTLSKFLGHIGDHLFALTPRLNLPDSTLRSNVSLLTWKIAIVCLLFPLSYINDKIVLCQ